jgi:hypothetical protein
MGKGANGCVAGAVVVAMERPRLRRTPPNKALQHDVRVKVDRK